MVAERGLDAPDRRARCKIISPLFVGVPRSSHRIQWGISVLANQFTTFTLTLKHMQTHHSVFPVCGDPSSQMPHGSSAAFTAILLRAAATSAAICISSSSSEAAVACVGQQAACRRGGFPHASAGDQLSIHKVFTGGGGW